MGHGAWELEPCMMT
jgi:hypothetical protein